MERVVSVGRRTGLKRRVSVIAAAGIAVLATVGTIESASAQGFFDFFFGNNTRRSQPQQQAPRANAYVDPNYPQYDPGDRDRVTDRPSQSGPAVAYCVRTCDGRFFPLQRASGANPAQTCSAFCPAARTKIYSGSSIDSASASDGKRYSDLDTAFVYREKTVAGCTCNGKDAFGLVNISATDDPTLRPGDIVATDKGMVAFRGGNGRRGSAEFTPIDSYSGLSPEMRRRLTEATIVPAPTPATAPAGQTSSAPAPADPRRVQLSQ
jgi:hypothetical protein